MEEKAIFHCPGLTDYAYLSDFKQVVEACQHKHFIDVITNVRDDDLATLGSGLLADGQQQAQTGTADVLQIGAVECDFLVGVIQQRSDFLLSSNGSGSVEAATDRGSATRVPYVL